MNNLVFGEPHTDKRSSACVSQSHLQREEAATVTYLNSWFIGINSQSVTSVKEGKHAELHIRARLNI